MNPLNDLGPCAVIFNSIDLGATMGGVQFRYTEETRPVHEDQQGVTEVDGIHVGNSCDVEVPLSRTTLGKLATVIGGVSYSGNLFKVKNNMVGTSQLSRAYPLILKPIVDGIATTDTSKWLTLYKAAPRVDAAVPFNNEGQRGYKIIFKCYPDADNNNQQWKIGA